jgi:small-conductance mechanosensitive channel
MDQIWNILRSFLEPTSVIIVLLILIGINNWFFKRIHSINTNAHFAKNAISFFLILTGVLIFVLALPIEPGLKGQILTFLGIIISAGIALSSTTILGNLIAGIMNNSMKRFKNGDLIKIGEFQGRVIKKSIFHTEIQLEDSNFITIPNLYIANNPVKLTRQTNTVISTSVSLGYDIPRTRIQKALIDAALAAGLKNPYVYINQLGDFSVVYEIHGFLDDSGKFFSTRSLLNSEVMDKLHENGIEIPSPSFMNQRRIDDRVFIPDMNIKEKTVETPENPEQLVFDEAIKSEKTEQKKEALKEIENKIEKRKQAIKEATNSEEAEKHKKAVDRYEQLKEALEKSIKDQLDQNPDK